MKSLIFCLFLLISNPAFACKNCVGILIHLSDKSEQILDRVADLGQDDPVYVKGYRDGVKRGFHTAAFAVNQKHPGCPVDFADLLIQLNKVEE